jgi:hypothetical protein
MLPALRTIDARYAISQTDARNRREAQLLQLELRAPKAGARERPLAHEGFH